MSDRRGFLRGLVTLPLIGGGVTLIGRPTSVDILPSAALRDTYLGWLRLEHTRVMHEIVDRWGPPGGGYFEHSPMFALPESPAMVQAIKSLPTASRAALVLSAVGIDWRTTGQACEGLANRRVPVPWRGEEDQRDPFRTYPAIFEARYGKPYYADEGPLA